jgi:hypothetical protein
MCVVSMIMDHYQEKWTPLVPAVQPWPFVITPVNTQTPITDAEIVEFRKLLDRAREYDKRNNEPDCELDAKVQALKQLAKVLGVELGL